MALNHSSASSLTDVSIEMPSLAEVFEVLTFQAGFNSTLVVIGATLLGIGAGTIGVFALLRNRALMADALAHSALPGLAIAFLLGVSTGIGGKELWLLLLGAIVSGVLGVLCVQALSRYTRLQEDAGIGIVLSCFFGAGVVLLSLIQSLGTGEEGGLGHFIFGQTAAMNRSDAYYMLTAALLSSGAALCLLKEFRVICFDEEFAASDGWPVSLIDLVMMSIVVLVTVVGMQSVGLLLIVAFLVIPPAAARFWTESLHTMVWSSAFIGGMSGYIGSSLSALLPRLPAGAVIVLVAGVLFTGSFLLAPRRGLLAVTLRQLQLRIRIQEDHLLRSLYEFFERDHRQESESELRFSLDAVPVFSASPLLHRHFLLWLLHRRGLISKSGTHYLLTKEGFSAAEGRVRNHRLWEEYLQTHTDIPASHVDYSADLVEHVLSPRIVKLLEAKLALKRQSETNVLEHDTVEA